MYNVFFLKSLRSKIPNKGMMLLKSYKMTYLTVGVCSSISHIKLLASHHAVTVHLAAVYSLGAPKFDSTSSELNILACTKIFISAAIGEL